MKKLILLSLLFVLPLCAAPTKKAKPKPKAAQPIKVPNTAPKEEKIFDVLLDNESDSLPPKVLRSSQRVKLEEKKLGGDTEIEFGVSERSGIPMTEQANPVHDPIHQNEYYIQGLP